MIDYIKYKLDGVTYNLINNGDDTWVRETNAPSAAGNYQMTLVVSEDGIVTTVDNSSSLYEVYLDIIVKTERIVFLQNYLSELIAETEEASAIFNIENRSLDDLHAEIEKVKSNNFITTASNDAITRTENYLSIKGLGTLGQRKDYLISLNQKGNKLNEVTIKNIVNSISGSDCVIVFFSTYEAGNLESDYGLLRIQVLSPDNKKDYRYADIARTLAPLIPSHIKLSVIKYFATWQNISDNFVNWADITALGDWESVKNYIPPQ